MRILTVLFSCFLFSCYQPTAFEPLESSSKSSSSQGNASFIISPINTDKQICNPAISQDTGIYAGTMLWLGFSGALNVKNAPAGYGIKNAVQHDRLTISKKDNSVAWFLLKDSVKDVQCEFQDPDWTTHNDWIVSMGARAENGDCQNDEFIYSGWVIRPKDNSRFRFNYESLDYISTPHVWISNEIVNPITKSIKDSVTYNEDGWATKESIQQYFGSDQIKIVWSTLQNGYTLWFLDYTKNTPKNIKLNKPKGRENWKAESAMISPDGNWIVYNLYDNASDYSVYIQKLEENSEPILLAQNAMDGRWWVHPSDNNRLFIVYMTVAAGNGYLVLQDLLNEELATSGAAGKTWLQEVKLFNDLPTSIGVELMNSPKLLVNLPFRGGLSQDGKYLATGTNYGYILELF